MKFKADREWSTTGKRLEPGMVPPGIVQNREWADRKRFDREWSTAEIGNTEIRLTEIRRPGKGLLPILRLKLRLTVSFIFWPPDAKSVAVTSLFKRVTSQLLLSVKGAALRVGLVKKVKTWKT